MANKYNLSHDTQYKVLSSNYLSIEDGGGTTCDNCNKFITTTVLVEDLNGKTFIVGADCALTLAGIGKNDEDEIKTVVRNCKKFYNELRKNKNNQIIKLCENYHIIRIVTKTINDIEINPFIHDTFIKVKEENLSDKFKHLVITVDEILQKYPELQNNYYIQQWKQF